MGDDGVQNRDGAVGFTVKLNAQVLHDTGGAIGSIPKVNNCFEGGGIRPRMGRQPGRGMYF